MEKIRTIRLYGELGVKFGREHHLAVRNSAEAISALCSMKPGFRRYLTTAKQRGVEFACFVGKRNIEKEELQDPVGDKAIRIAPIIKGAKRAGLFQTVLGVALMLASGPLTTVFGPTVGVAAFKIGLGMTIGGVIQMISATTVGSSTSDDSGVEGSVFSGVSNTTAVGSCVPVAYGEVICGSALISGGIYAEDKA